MSMRVPILCIISVLIVYLNFFTYTQAAGIYEEQAGIIDWYQPHVGGVVTTLINNKSNKNNNIIVTTDKNILASLNKNGTIKWRQNFELEEIVHSRLVVNKNGHVFIVSRSFSNEQIFYYFRTFNFNDGALEWEINIDSSLLGNNNTRGNNKNEGKQVETVLFGKNLLISIENDLFFLDFSSGTLLWNKNVELKENSQKEKLKNKNFGILSVPGSDPSFYFFFQKQLFYFNSLLSNTPTYVNYNINNNKKDTDNDSNTFISSLFLNDLAIILDNQGSFNFYFITKGNINEANNKLEKLSIPVPDAVKKILNENKKKNEKIELAAIGKDQTFLLKTSTHQFIFVIKTQQIKENKNQANLISYLSVPQNIHVPLMNLLESPGSSESDDQKVSYLSDYINLLRLSEKSKKQILQVSSFSLEDVNKYVDNKNEFNWIDVTLPYETSNKIKSATSYNNFILITTEDRSVIKLKIEFDGSRLSSSSLEFALEEGLSSISTENNLVLLIDVPSASSLNLNDEYYATHFPNFFERLVPQLISGVNTVKGLFTSAVQTAENFYSLYVLNQQIPPSLSSTESFFSKMIVAANSYNTLYGISCVNGGIVWKKASSHFNVDQGFVFNKFFYIGHHNIIILATNPASGSSYLYTVNALSGDILESKPINYLITESMQLPYTDSNSMNVLLFVDSNNQVHAYPNTNEVNEIVNKRVADIFLYRTNLKNNTITGFALKSTSVSASSFSFTVFPTWSLSFPDPLEEISAISSREPYETVQSSVRIIGGENAQSFLYKYLSPSLLAVATVRNSPGPDLEGLAVKKSTDPCVVLTLIDTVTGSVIDKYIHQRASGPVHLAVTENLVVMHYYQPNSNSYEVSVVELFEQKTVGALTLQTIIASITNTIPISTFSSFTPVQSTALQQSYVMRSGVRYIGVTKTGRGITNKDFLFALDNDSIQSIPRVLLDPRRIPIDQMSANDKAEGLIPYGPEIPLDPRSTISHFNKITNLNKIISAPATLESHSLIFAFGVDLFFTRVTPSGSFDVLNDDFNYPFLILTVLSVCIGCVVTRSMAKQKDVAANWK